VAKATIPGGGGSNGSQCVRDNTRGRGGRSRKR
jgi:hypothetical protein